MEKKERKKKIANLLKERKRIDNEIKEIEKQLVKELCPKGKTFCEPAYCTFRYTNTCPFLKEWRRISKNS